MCVLCAINKFSGNRFSSVVSNRISIRISKESSELKKGYQQSIAKKLKALLAFFLFLVPSSLWCFAPLIMCNNNYWSKAKESGRSINACIVSVGMGENDNNVYRINKKRESVVKLLFVSLLFSLVSASFLSPFRPPAPVRNNLCVHNKTSQQKWKSNLDEIAFIGWY